MKEIQIEDDILEKDKFDETKRNWSTASVDDKIRYAENVRKKYHRGGLSKEYLDTFKGEKYSDETLAKQGKTLVDVKGKGSISIHRTGGHSVAVLMMLSETDEKGNPKYTLDDIYDNTKYVEHKQELFDFIVKKNAINGKEEKEYFAKAIYEGLKTVARISDELAKQIDFEDEDFDLTENFIKMSSICNIAYDAWQDFCDYKDVALAVVKAEVKEVKNWEDAHEYTKHLAGAPGHAYDYCGWVVNYHLHFDEIMANDNAESAKAHASYVTGALKREYIKRAFREYQKKGKGTGFTEYCHKNGIMDKIYNIYTPPLDEIRSDKALFDEFDRLAADGTIFSGVQFVEGENDIKDIKRFPTVDLKNHKFIIPGFKKRKQKNVDKAKASTENHSSKRVSLKDTKVVPEKTEKIVPEALGEDKALKMKAVFNSQVTLETKLSCYISFVNLKKIGFQDNSWSQKEDEALEEIWNWIDETYINGADEIGRRRVFECLGRISTENDINVYKEMKKILEGEELKEQDPALRKKKATYLARTTSDPATYTASINDVIGQAKNACIMSNAMEKALKKEFNITNDTTMAQLASLIGYNTPEDIQDYLNTRGANAEDKVIAFHRQKRVDTGMIVPSMKLVNNDIMDDIKSRRIDLYRLNGKREVMLAGKFNDIEKQDINEMIRANGEELSVSGIDGWAKTKEIEDKVKTEGDLSLNRVRESIEATLIRPYEEEIRFKAESLERKRQPVRQAFAPFFEEEEDGVYKSSNFDVETAKRYDRDLDIDIMSESNKIMDVHCNLMNVEAYGSIYANAVGATRTPTVNSLMYLWAIATHPELKASDLKRLDENPEIREGFRRFCLENPAVNAPSKEKYISSVKNWADLLKLATSRVKKFKFPDADFSDPVSLKENMLELYKFRMMIIDFSQQKDAIFGNCFGLSGKQIAEEHIGNISYQDMLEFWADSQNYISALDNSCFANKTLTKKLNTANGIDELSKIAVNKAIAVNLLNSSKGKAYGDVMAGLGSRKYYYSIITAELSEMFLDGEQKPEFKAVAPISREEIFNYLKGKNKKAFEKKVKKLVAYVEPRCKKEGILEQNQFGVADFRNTISFGDAYDKLKDLPDNAEATLAFLNSDERLMGISLFDNGVLPSAWIADTSRKLFCENFEQRISTLGYKKSDMMLIDGKSPKELWGEKYANVENDNIRENCYQVEFLKALIGGRSNLSIKNIAVGSDNKLSVTGKINLTRSTEELQKMKRSYIPYNAGAKRIKEELKEFQDQIFESHNDPDKAKREIGKVGSDLFKELEKSLDAAIKALGDSTNTVDQIEKSLKRFRDASEKYYKERKNLFFKKDDNGQIRLDVAKSAKDIMPEIIMNYEDITRGFKCDIMVNAETNMKNCSVFAYRSAFSNILSKGTMNKITNLSSISMTADEINADLDNKRAVSHEKIILKDEIAKGLSAMNISYSEYRNEYKIMKNPDASHMAVVYYVNKMIDRMDADGVTVADIKAMQNETKASFKDGTFKKQADSLASNTVFKEILKINQKNFHKEWERIEKNTTASINRLKDELKAVSDVDKDAAKYIMSGEVNGEGLPHGEAELNACYERLGTIVAKQILTDPKNRMVVQAIESGRMDYEEVITATTEKMKNNHVLEGNHFTVAALHGKLENGRLMNMAVKSITSQAKTNTKTRLPASFKSKASPDIVNAPGLIH